MDRRAFTLVEMLVSVAIVALLTLVLVQMTSATSNIWQYTNSRSEQFNHASQAFEAITRRLSQATLNTYWDYADSKNGFSTSTATITPTKYQRQSQLRFLTDKATTLFALDTTGKIPSAPRYGNAIFFQAPLGYTEDLVNFGGMPNLLNTWGYYLEFSPENRPKIIEGLGTSAPPQRYRYRLMEMMEPSNILGVYRSAPGAVDWFTTGLAPDTLTTHLLAENIIQLVILPRLSKQDELAKPAPLALAPNYRYDSTMATIKPAATDTRWLNQLPPVVQVTMVAIDEPSAARATRGSTEPAFHTALSTFTTSAQYDSDLAALQTALVTAKLNYRVFTSNVSIRGARWSPN